MDKTYNYTIQLHITPSYVYTTIICNVGIWKGSSNRSEKHLAIERDLAWSLQNALGMSNKMSRASELLGKIFRKLHTLHFA